LDIGFTNMQLWAATASEFAVQAKPFLFVINYDLTQAYLLPPEQAAAHNVFFAVAGHSNFPFAQYPSQQVHIEKHAIDKEQYTAAFAHIQAHLHRGDSFLVNLTQATPINCSLSLQQIFEFSRAKYQLYFQDSFVTFSPETFIKIKNGQIATYPMKGTIAAHIPNAERVILENKKEMAEHATIVDLLRNDLSTVASKVWVERYRYIDHIKTQSTDLLQVSSEIKGQLPSNWQQNLGQIILKLLPAGSICGAPKPATLQIIAEAEGYNRGFYTGIVGYFDGQNLDTGVMIRFIEKTEKGLVFKSGGGITSQSVLENEYQELLDKIYIPTVQ
jgi:para-aminobenzoate synthetase component I